MKKRVVLLLTGLCCLALLAGCSSTPETGDDGVTTPPENGQAVEPVASGGRESKILTMSESAGSPSGVFNPLFISDEYNREVCEIVFEALVEMDPNFNITPGLAESWEISEDNKSITFYLRQGVTWHDGEPFTADDVVFSYDLLCHPEVNTYYGSYATVLLGYQERKDGLAETVAGIEKLDDYTVRFTTTDVYGMFLSAFANYIRIIPVHIWGAVEPATIEEQTDLMRNPIGTGPFQMTEFKLDEYIIFDRYDDYWGGLSDLERIVFRVMTSDATLAGALNGEIDFGRIGDMNPDDLAMYEDAGFQIQQLYYNSTQMMVVNNSHPLLGDKRVRQAFAHAINRQGIVDSLLYGYGAVANQPYRPGLFVTPEPSQLNQYEYDSEKAIQILTEEVGWSFENGTMYDAAGNPVKFSLIYPQGNIARERSAPVIQENFKEIGIELDLEIMEFATLTSRCGAGDYELALMGSGANDPNLISFYNNGSNDYAGFVSAELQALFEEGLRHVDQDEQRVYYVQAAQLLNEEMPSVYLYHWYDGRFVASDLQGVQASAITNFYQLINWRFE